MNRILAIALLGVLFVITMPRVSAQQAPEGKGGATLRIKVSGAKSAKGTIRAALFQSANGFPTDPTQAIQRQAADIDPQTLSAQITFAGLPAGTYAVSVFHDENMNQKIDKNLMGIPKEGYGASNNPKKKRRAPTFDEAKFSLKSTDQTIEIRLIY